MVRAIIRGRLQSVASRPSCTICFSTIVITIGSWSAPRSPPAHPAAPADQIMADAKQPDRPLARATQLSLYLDAMERAGAAPLSLRAPRRGRPSCPHGPVAGKAAASALGGRAGARDPGRVTRPVATATAHTAATLAPPMGGSRLQNTGRQH